MNKQMDKRGITTMMMILEIIIILLAAYSIFSIASKYASSETTNKIIIADDIKMMVDTLIGTPGEAVVRYPGDVFKYTFILSSSSVSVFIKGEGEQKKIVRYFSLPEGYQAFGTLEGKSNLCLEKEKKKIVLRGCGEKKTEEPEEISPPQTQIPSGPTFFGLTVEEDPVVFVIDHSYSMKDASDWQFPKGIVPPGEMKIDVVKWQLKQTLQGMEDGKMFNIVFFDSSVQRFKSGLMELNAESRQEANHFIDQFQEGTRTNTGEALENALSLGKMEAIYLLSDGSPDNVLIAHTQIQKANAGKNVKINTIGIFTKIPEDASEFKRKELEDAKEQGISFLQQVAKESGGKFVTMSENDQSELEG